MKATLDDGRQLAGQMLAFDKVGSASNAYVVSQFADITNSI
jgi:hypothetical protein